VLRFQNHHMRRRLLQYKAVLDRFGLGGLQEAALAPVPAVDTMTTPPHDQPPPRKKQAVAASVASMQERLYCDLCRGAEAKERGGDTMVWSLDVQGLCDRAEARAQSALPGVSHLVLGARGPAAVGTMQRVRFEIDDAVTSFTTKAITRQYGAVMNRRSLIGI
jgi:hypothetical protein